MDLEIYIRVIKLAKYEELRPAAYGVQNVSIKRHENTFKTSLKHPKFTCRRHKDRVYLHFDQNPTASFSPLVFRLSGC